MKKNLLFVIKGHDAVLVFKQNPFSIKEIWIKDADAYLNPTMSVLSDLN